MNAPRHIGQLIVATGPEETITLPLFQREDGSLFFAPFEDIADGDEIAELTEKVSQVIEVVRQDEILAETEWEVWTDAAAGGGGPLSLFTLVTTDTPHTQRVYGPCKPQSSNG